MGLKPKTNFKACNRDFTAAKRTNRALIEKGGGKLVFRQCEEVNLLHQTLIPGLVDYSLSELAITCILKPCTRTGLVRQQDTKFNLALGNRYVHHV